MYIMVQHAIHYNQKEIAAIPDDLIIDLYQRAVEYVETEGWEYDVSAQCDLSSKLWDEIDRRTKSSA